MELPDLTREWEMREEALSLEYYNQHAGLPVDDQHMQRLAGEIEDLAMRGLEGFHRGDVPDLLWLALVANANAAELTRYSNEIYRKRNEEVRVQMAGETVTLNNVRRFNQRHLREPQLRRQAFDALMERAIVLTATLERRFRLSADAWAKFDLTPLDVYLVEERLDLETLRRVVDESAKRAKPAFLREAERFSEEILGKPFEYYDDMYVFRHAIHNPVDAAFERVDFEDSFRRLAEALGFDLERIHIDGEPREGKYSSPICFGVRIPGDVRVLYQRTTPLGDYESFYHEMGHAVHFASVDPTRRFDERRLIPNGIAEVFSTLFEDVAMDPVYLREDMGLDDATVAEIGRRRRFMDLYFLVFYGANAMHKIRFWDERLHQDFPSADELYADLTEEYMGVRYPGVYWQTHHVLSTSDMYAPSYLLAHIRKAELVRELRSRFGRAWWREPEAGEWLRESCMAPGASIDLDAFSRLDAAAYLDPIVQGGAA